jgi:hypothetical protein
MTSRVGSGRILKLIMGTAALMALPGCITLQAIEPVVEPPAQFMGDVTVPVEFAVPGTIGFRCAERGATFLGLPGINSGACADTTLVTMLDPCMTLTAGPYAQALCDGLKQHRSEADAGPKVAEVRAATPAAGLVKASFSASLKPAVAVQPQTRELSAWDNVVVEFVNPEDVEMRCAERGAKMAAAHSGVMSCADRLLMTVANPCRSEEQSWYTRTLCHELAHANGWPSDHPAHYQHVVLRPASQSPQAIALAGGKVAAPEPVLVAGADFAMSDLAPSPLATTAPAFKQPAELATDLPVGLRQLMIDFVSFGLSVRATAPEAMATHFRTAAWKLLAPAAPDEVPAEANTASRGGMASLLARDHVRLTPLRGRSYADLARNHAAAASMQGSH